MSDLEEYSETEYNSKNNASGSDTEEDNYTSDAEASDADDNVLVGGADEDASEAEDEPVEAEEAQESEAEEQESETEEELESLDKPVTKSKYSASKAEAQELSEAEDTDEETDDEDENYLQKFDYEIRKDYISNNHPECFSHNYEEIKNMTRVVRNKVGIICDNLHRTIPILTKYEKTRVLGQRAKQIDAGAKPLVVVPPNIVDGYLIARMELEQKKMPFIIKRPLPSGGFEYWDVNDLELI